jgi:hypothetical protein
MQFNAVVETNEHASSAVRVARLHDSEGVHLNQIGGVGHHDVGSRHPHQARRGGEGSAPDRRESTRMRPPMFGAPLLSLSRQRDRSERARD